MNARIVSLFAVLSLFLLPSAALAREKTAAPQPRPQKGKLVFVATTGLEDVLTLTSSFRHAQGALESGHLESVVWLSYGRAVVALDPTVEAVPSSVRKAAAEAKAAGVKLVACATALKKFGIAPDRLQPDAEVVANGAHELARLVAEGYAVIRY